MSEYDIFQAIFLRDRELVKKLLESGADINSLNDQGKTPLLIALEDPNIQVDFAKFLIDQGANISFRNQVKNQSGLNEIENAELLVHKKGLDDNAMKPLKLLSGLSKMFINMGPQLNTLTDMNVLKSAIESKDLQKIALVLNYDIDVIYKNQASLGALYDFCSTFKRNRSEEMLTCLFTLLTKGCNDFEHNGYGESALKFLTNEGHLEAVKMLVKFGEALGELLEPLNWSEDHRSVVFSDLKILKNNLDLFSISTTDQFHRTPLMLFMHFRSANEIREILNDLKALDIYLNDIKKGIDLLVKSDKCNELQEVLKYYPANEEVCHRLLMLSRMHRSPACSDFLLQMNIGLSNKKILNEKDLIAEIKTAFKGVKLNDGTSLLFAEALDNYGYDELYDMREEEENWENISFEELNESRGGIFYLNSKGLLFYLPAYMVCDLSDKLCSDLISCFTSRNYDELTNNFLNFNYEQMSALTNCFEFFQEKDRFNTFYLKESIASIEKEIPSFYTNSLNNRNDKIDELISNLKKIVETKLPLKQKNFTGKWQAFYENGTMLYESEYKNGKQHGKEKSWHPNGALQSEDEYKESIIDGKTITWYPNGSLQSEGEYKNGALIKTLTFWHLNGSKQSETIYTDKDGNRKGKSTTWFSNGNKSSESLYLDDIPHGKYLKWDENGKIVINQDYKDGEMIKDHLAQKNET